MVEANRGDARAVDRRLMGAALAVAVLLACGCPREPDRAGMPTAGSPATRMDDNAPEPGPQTGSVGADAGARPAGEIVLSVTDPEILERLEAGGYGLATLLDGAPPAARTSNAIAARGKRYQAAIAAIRANVQALQRRDPHTSMRSLAKPHRLFDLHALTTQEASFDLVAVVNRADRRVFHPERCGETRLVYRLSYRTRLGASPMVSRYPATIVLSYWASPPSDPSACDATAKSWIRPPADSRKVDDFLTAAEGPLARAKLAPDRLKAVEINVQRVRWPSTVRPDTAGHAEYLLVALQPAPDGALKKGPLENTPDVDKIRRSPALRKRLVALLSDPKSLAAIERGNFVLPDEFAATESVSVSPHGMARLANRPFSAAVGKALAIPDTALRSHARLFSSQKGLLRRLDGMSCAGCHQTRSTAGFHLLGTEPKTGPMRALPGNALTSGLSAHLTAELERRRAFMNEIAQGVSPVHERVPFPDRPSESPGRYGDACRWDGWDFPNWKCGPGLACQQASADDELGVCLDDRFSEGRQVGDPCEVGKWKGSDDPLTDRIQGAKPGGCAPGLVCERSAVGFPDGMCAGPCNSADARTACGAIAILRGFNDCLARKEPFHDCLAHNARPAAMRRCDDAHPCRDDYICTLTAKGEGTCIPPYFLFQLRVDGHPPL